MYIRPHPFGCLRMHMDSPTFVGKNQRNHPFLNWWQQMGSSPSFTAKIKTRYPNGYLVFMAEDEGFEPPQTESESGVLPLHKSSIAGTFVIILTFFKKSRSFLKFFQIFFKNILPQQKVLYSSHGKGFPAKTWFFK